MYEEIFKRIESDIAKVVLLKSEEKNLLESETECNLEPTVGSPKNSSARISSDYMNFFYSTFEGISVYNLLEYYYSRGIVGEESACILQTLCEIEGISFGIEGRGGSGKSLILDSLVDLLPEDTIYKAESSSDLALFYDHKEINKSKYLYMSEIRTPIGSRSYQITELIKDLSEGKSSSRRVTLPNRKVAKYKIKKGVSVMYTLADENGFEKNEELSRCVVRIRTDNSCESVEDILRAETSERMGSTTESSHESSSSDYSDLGAYVASCSNLDVKIIDPFAEYVRGCFNEKMTSSDFKKYNSLLEACVKFNHPKRQKIKGGLLVNLEDHVLVYSLFCTSTVEGSDKLNREGEDSIVQYEKAVNSGMKVMKKKLRSKPLAKWASHQINFMAREPWVSDYLEKFMDVHYRNFRCSF